LNTNVDPSLPDLPDLPDLLLRAAAAAAGPQQFASGALYVVATPIGNLADITLRALHVLARVDAVACEDTRVSGALLAHYGLRKPLVAVHAHNEQAATAPVLAHLARGETVALVTDAGTPAISDPGARLVAAASEAGFRVVPIPGACSVVAALSAAGDLRGEGCRIVGFLPAKGGERAARLQALLDEGTPFALFEAPHRIEALAAELAERCAARRVTLTRELTKQFETIVTMAACAMPAWLAADAQRRRGEFVVVVHASEPAAAAAKQPLPAEALRTLTVLQRELPLKQAVALAAEISGAPRNALYAEALKRQRG
jgi:16S rRNA (cytidine1402-2'-O)-methyltransferase